VKFISNMNPTLRGFLIIAAIAGVIAAFSLGPVLAWLGLILSILFLVVLAIVAYRWWRNNRYEIAQMPRRVQLVLYGGAAVVLVDFAVYFVFRGTGLDALAFLLVIAVCGYAMWRAWRDQHTYS
jgi:uncharacterized membrane protein